MRKIREILQQVHDIHLAYQNHGAKTGKKKLSLEEKYNFYKNELKQ
jgi:hypothetical protein